MILYSVEVTVTQMDGAPVKEQTLALPKHKKNLDIGNKSTTYASQMYIEQEDAASFASNEEVTFMDWGNAYILKSPTSSAPITKLDVQLHLDGDFKKTSKKVHWLAICPTAPLVEVVLKDYDYLITKKKIEEEDDWVDFINLETEFREEAFADANVRELKQGDIIQFERKGFYICDKSLSEQGGVMEFISIPDGKSASVSLKAKPATAKKTVGETLQELVNGEVPLVSGLPEKVPSSAKPFTLVSRGMSIPVTTKVGEVSSVIPNLMADDVSLMQMYKVESTTGEYKPVTRTKMHAVPSLTS